MMLPDATPPVPSSLVNLLAVLFPLFTATSFRTFCGLACGFLAQTGKRTVCGMLIGAGLAQVWPHGRAHWLFSRARWNLDELRITVAKLVVALLVRPGSRSPSRSTTRCSSGGGRRCGPHHGFTTTRRRDRLRPDTAATTTTTLRGNDESDTSEAHGHDADLTDKQRMGRADGQMSPEPGTRQA